MEQTREKGRRWVISTQEELRQAVIDVVSESTRKVAIFTHDLEPGIYDDPDFLEIIKKLCLAQTYARVRVLIADPTRTLPWCIRSAPGRVIRCNIRALRFEVPAGRRIVARSHSSVARFSLLNRKFPSPRSGTARMRIVLISLHSPKNVTQLALQELMRPVRLRDWRY